MIFSEFIVYDLDHYELPLEELFFADGEYKYICPVYGCDGVLLVGPAYPFTNIERMLMIVSAIRNSNPACRISYLLPYLPYCRQDKPKQGESAGLEIIASILNSCQFHRIFLIHPHSPIANKLLHHSHEISIAPLIQEILGQDKNEQIILVAPDEGASGYVSMIAQQYGYEMVSGHKQRSTYNEVDTITISSQDQAKIVNKVCYIIDDMYDTGGTLNKLASILRDQGAKTIKARCTHGLCNGSWQVRLDKELLSQLYFTDTLPHPLHQKIITRDIYQYCLDAALSSLDS